MKSLTVVFTLSLSVLSLNGCATTAAAPTGDRPPTAIVPALAPAPTRTVYVAAPPYVAPPQHGILPNPASEPERSVLARLDHELAVLQSLVSRAEAVRNPDARIPFDYAGLRRDLEMVRGGVREHLANPGQQPRQFEPLRGDYRP